MTPTPPDPTRPAPAGRVLRCADVSVEVPGAQERSAVLLRDLTVELTESRIAVVGLNGSGKSTLLRLLNGLMLPSRGTVTVHGTDVARSTAQARRLVGFLFSDPLAQLLMPTPVEDVQLSLRRSHRDPAERAARAEQLLREAGLGHRMHHSVHDLSGGERQLVALTALLAVEPAVLALDEPTTLLDLRHRDRLIARLDGLPQQQVIATHDLELAATAQRVLVIHRGRLLADGPAERTLAAYRTWCAQGFPDEHDDAPSPDAGPAPRAER